MDALTSVRASVRDYYSAKVRKWGPTPAGVDWRDEPTQQLRLLKLLRITDTPLEHSWNDLGCGYGALLGLLEERYGAGALDYCGVDLCEEMIAHAEHRFGTWRGVRFAVGERCDRVADYTVASGIFNVQLGRPREVWETLVETTLREMFEASALAAAVNFKQPMPGQSGTGTMLYTTVPDRWEAFASHCLGASVEIVDGYAMAEFTLILRRTNTMERASG